MGFTYKLSRRLAQIQFFALTIFAAACSDAIHSPEETVEEINESNVVDVGIPHLALSAVNQPVNFALLNQRTFNTRAEPGWWTRSDAAFTIASDGNAPASPSNIGRANFKAGFRGGAAPILTSYTLPGKKNNIYLSFWVKLSSNWVGHSSGVNKIFFFRINRGNKVYLTAQGSGNTPLLLPQVRVQGINENPVTRNLYSNVTPYYMKRGTWHRWEVILRSNTNGQPNGVAEWWVDGVRVGYYNNVNYVSTSATRHWEVVKWNPTWGGMGGTVPASQDMWIDETYVSGI